MGADGTGILVVFSLPFCLVIVRGAVEIAVREDERFGNQPEGAIGGLARGVRDLDPAPLDKPIWPPRLRVEFQLENRYKTGA